MGQQRRIKQLRRELKHMWRKNQQEEIYFAGKYKVSSAVAEELIPDGDQDQIADLEQIDEDEEINAILKRLMPVLPSFSGKNFDLWKMKMEGLLGSVDLWEFVQNGYEDPTEKRRDKLTLYLVSSALNNGILSALLYEFGEIENAKMFWDNLEMKFSVRGSKIAKDKINHVTAVENGECIDSLITEIKTGNDCIEIAMIDDESVYVADCDNENENLVEEDLFEGETYEVRFDEDNSSNEEWSKLMHEKHLIDELLFGEKNGPLAYTNQVEDNFIVAEKEEKEDEEEKNQKALLEEQNEMSKNCIDTLMNVFECAGFTKEECDVKHLGEVPDKFDEELEFIEEWLQKPYYDECKETLDYDEDCMDTEEEEDCITDIEIESVFIKWSPEEIKYYYELMLQESVEQDIVDCIQKWEQHIYVELEAFANIKDKCSQENAEVLRTKNNNQKSNSKMPRNKVKRAMKQNRVKMKHIWSSKPRKKLHLHHYLRSRKVKMKLLICKPS
jgi:hypothetical protein